MVKLPNFIKSMMRLKELYLQENEFTDIGICIIIIYRYLYNNWSFTPIDYDKCFCTSVNFRKLNMNVAVG
jgi:hypothetical protein